MQVAPLTCASWLRNPREMSTGTRWNNPSPHPALTAHGHLGRPAMRRKSSSGDRCDVKTRQLQGGLQGAGVQGRLASTPELEPPEARWSIHPSVHPGPRRASFLCSGEPTLPGSGCIWAFASVLLAGSRAAATEAAVGGNVRPEELHEGRWGGHQTRVA